MGLDELRRSLSKERFAAALQALIPEVTAGDLAPAHSGIRAQAINADGTLVTDFLIRRTERMIHVLNAPSPGATSCLSIAETIIAEAGEELEKCAGIQEQPAGM
jgi:L-2-hydroxyglutarate oxidase